MFKSVIIELSVEVLMKVDEFLYDHIGPVITYFYINFVEIE